MFFGGCKRNTVKMRDRERESKWENESEKERNCCGFLILF